MQHLKDRAFNEFELLLELKTYPEDEFVDFAALREEIQGLKDKLRTLGNINFAAFEEYQQEKQRLEFMTGTASGPARSGEDTARHDRRDQRDGAADVHGDIREDPRRTSSRRSRVCSIPATNAI